MSALRPIAALLLLLTAGCNETPPQFETRIAAFGTLVEITILSDDQALTEQVTASIDSEFQALHRRWHAWEPGALGTINRAIAEGESIDIDPTMAALIKRARELERASDGLFNPAIGQLLSLWGFHASDLPEGPPPEAETIARLVAQEPSLDALVFDGHRVRSRNPVVQLDFGAFIKGHAVDRAIELLERAGIEHAIVNAGGDLGVLGDRGNGPWRVAVRHPGGNGEQMLARLKVHDGEAVFTSGNYLRYRSDEGLRHGHILDPRSGYPADHVASVTVIHENGATADAAATALAVAGPEEWPRIAQGLGLEQVMRVDADGMVWMTPAMSRRSEFRGAVESRIQSLPPGR